MSTFGERRGSGAVDYPVISTPSAQLGQLSKRRSSSGWFVAVLAAAVLGATAGGAAGVAFGARMMSQDKPPSTAAPVSSNEINAATTDLCTRFAAGYQSMPSPQESGFDLLPTLNYIADALRDNPEADAEIRAAIAESLRQAREHAAWLINDRRAGAIQPPSSWSKDSANAADQRVWDLCRAYSK
ncbi:hypothetical protein [Mycolicibacterium sp.]|uniref:hypothetical protein n=1 Tax=Mycolicibacterium sp. TaxID=2320850 RepID=UPI0037C625B4